MSGSSPFYGGKDDAAESEGLLGQRKDGETRPDMYEMKTRNGGEPVVPAESEPFLGAAASEPVKLSPSWEESTLPQEQLNFHDTDNQEVEREPPDRLNLVYLTLVLHGIGTLMAWNMFITAFPYFSDYKLGQNYTGEAFVPEYRRYFFAYMGFAAQIPNVVLNWMNIFLQIGGNMTLRIVWSIVIAVVMVIVTVIMAMVDTSSVPDVFFWLTMVVVVILNMANGIYQNTVYGLAAKLPFKYTGAVVLGSNVSGTFTAVISILSLWLAPDARTAAIYYFITALFVLLACFDTYFALPLNRFYRYHERKSAVRNVAVAVPGRPPYFYILKKCLPQCINVFLVFFVTLACFPIVQSSIKPIDIDGFFLPLKYFSPVTCYLTFNFYAMLGSFLPLFIQRPGPRWLWLPIVLRLLFIPFYAFCNYQPPEKHRLLPVIVTNDYVYWVVAKIMAITSGYFSSLAMMYCPRTVESEFAPTAGMFGAASLVSGIFAGVNFSSAITAFVENVTFEWPPDWWPF